MTSHGASPRILSLSCSYNLLVMYSTPQRLRAYISPYPRCCSCCHYPRPQADRSVAFVLVGHLTAEIPATPSSSIHCHVGTSSPSCNTMPGREDHYASVVHASCRQHPGRRWARYLHTHNTSYKDLYIRRRASLGSHSLMMAQQHGWWRCTGDGFNNTDSGAKPVDGVESHAVQPTS